MTSDHFAQAFWAGCNAEHGELRYQACTHCAHVQFYPRPFCARCSSEALDWQTARGDGVVYAVTAVERAPTPEFRALQPYTIALIDLDEGFRIMAHAEAGVAIGDRVSVTFFQFQDRRLPRFVRAPK